MARRRRRGSATVDWVLVIGLVALGALAGIALLGQQTSGQGARLAASLAGGAPAVISAEAPGNPAASGTPDNYAADEGSPLDYAVGFLRGVFENLLDELSLFIDPLETLAALTELGLMLAEDLAGTAQRVLDELLLEPLDTLVNGTPFDQGFVVGQQISPTRALSVVSKLAAIGAVVAPAKRASNQVVIGHGFQVDGHPSYVELSDQLGARRFEVPDDVWARMTPDQRVEANLKFLDRAIARGDEIILSTPAGLAQADSFYDLELQHLRERGYTFSDDGLRAIPPDGS